MLLHAVAAWLIRSVFRFISYAFVVLGTATIAARLAAGGLGVFSDFAGLQVFALQTGVTFLIAGLTIAYLSHSKTPLLPNERRDNDASEPLRLGWLSLLAPCLLALPIAALVQLGPLKALWYASHALWTRANPSGEVSSMPEFSELIIVPVAAGLLVPLVELILTASFLISTPALLVLFAWRSRLFPRVFLMCVLCQCALLLCSRYAVELDVVGRISQPMEQETRDAGSADGAILLEWAQRHQSAVGPVATRLTWTFAGYALWLPVLLATERGRKSFTRDPATATTFAFRSLRSLTRIAFQGKTYKSVEEMPDDVRQKYETVIAALGQVEKHAHDGPETLGVRAVSHLFQWILHNGRTHKSMNELPSEAPERTRMVLGDESRRNLEPGQLS